MHKLKIVISIITFSSLLIGTSIIKNQSRETEKKIFKLNRIIALKKNCNKKKKKRKKNRKEVKTIILIKQVSISKII